MLGVVVVVVRVGVQLAPGIGQWEFPFPDTDEVDGGTIVGTLIVLTTLDRSVVAADDCGVVTSDVGDVGVPPPD